MPTPAHVICAVPTPFTPSGELDLPGLRTVLRALPAEIHAAFLPGTTGEFPALSDYERIVVIGEAIDVLGSGKVIAHIGAASAHQAEALARRAASAGVRRIAAINPYFLPAPESAVRDYYARIIEATGVDTFAYLFPERTGYVVPPAQLAGLADLPGLVGAKLSGAAAAAFADYAAAVPAGFTLYSGNDGDLPEVIAAGGAGVVSGVSSAFPEPLLEQARALADGDDELVDKLRPLIDRLVGLVGPSIAATKLAVRLRTGVNDTVRMALDVPDAAQRAQIEAAAAELGPLK